MAAVEDGVDALRYMGGHAPNLVLLDLQLPRLDGRDVQRELAAHPETRGILKKPVSTDSLLEPLAERLDQLTH